MIWSLLIEVLLVLLLTATIYFAIRLNKRLTVLRVEKEQLDELSIATTVLLKLHLFILFITLSKYHSA